MNFKLELPEETILVNRTELREVLRDMFVEVQGDVLGEEIMTIRDAAKYLKVSIPTVRKLIAEEEIPYFQRGQIIRLSSRDISEWLRENSIKNLS